MIRALRPSAMAQDDASLVSGWNIAPNVAYILRLLPGPASCGVLLYSDDNVLIATGAALVGTEQPCILFPQNGQAVGMIDAELGWHLLITTTGTEPQREIRIGPAVDLPDEIHPAYGADDLAVARATAAIDDAAHYIDAVTVTCPLGLGAGLGDVASAPVDGVAVVGQVESITWAATPDGATGQAVVRRHVAIAPESFREPTPPTVLDDVGTATHLTGSSGNVLANDDSGLAVTAINGLSGNVGLAVDGDNGGSFVVNSDGSWSFEPDGDFDLLGASETADTSITYYASDGTLEAMATLTITVGRANTPPVAVDDVGETSTAMTTGGNVLDNDTDADGDALSVVSVNGQPSNVGVAVAGNTGGLFVVNADGSWTFDPNDDFDLAEGQTGVSSVTYRLSDGTAYDDGTITVNVSPFTGVTLVGVTTGVAYAAPLTVPLPSGVQEGDLIIVLAGAVSIGSLIPAITNPLDFTSLYSVFVNDSADTNLRIYYKIAGMVPDTEVTTSASQHATRGSGTMVCVFRGVDQSNPFDVNYVAASGIDSTAANSPQIEPVTDQSVLFTIGAWTYRTGAGATPPIGFDQIGALCADAGYMFTMHAATRLWSTTDGPVDPGAWTGQATHSSSSWVAVTLALRPA